jgi:hypothetical protein
LCKKENKTYQNEFNNQQKKVAEKWDLANTHLQKYTLEKTQACKKH